MRILERLKTPAQWAFFILSFYGTSNLHSHEPLPIDLIGFVENTSNFIIVTYSKKVSIIINIPQEIIIPFKTSMTR